jgi:HK97 family phage prohead protease
VVFLINHDGLPLARTRSGTLELKEDETGLWMGADLDPEDPDVRSIVPKMKRGDLDKMSFAFRVKKEEWDETVDPPRRTIRAVDLVDVAIVTTPAYDGTSIALRSLDDARKDRRAQNFNAAAQRIRNRNKIALAEK